ncbi:MAG: FMN-binding protein, partial [Deltaproteobacteria bacterium]|nr:FMN-binding protein [Deltaproteobacteria bacterium]
MREMITMVLVLSVMSLASGGLLSFLNNNYKESIEINELDFVKGPAIKSIFDGSTNNPIADRFKIMDGDIERTFFVGKFNGKANTVALEGVGKGYGGEFGIIFAVNVEEDKIVGVEVTTHSETPGFGANAKDDPTFVAQFKGLSAVGPFKISNDGGQINAMSGATITSKAVCDATSEAGQ